MPKYCNSCVFLNIDEDEQRRIKREQGILHIHICLKYMVRVRHYPYKEPYIHPCKECDKEVKCHKKFYV